MLTLSTIFLSLSLFHSLSLNCFHETFYILYEGNIINLVVNSIRTKRPVVRVCSYTQLNSLDKIISNHKPREILNYIFITNLTSWYFIFAMYDYFSEADYIRIWVQWKYSVSLWRIHWFQTSWEGSPPFIDMKSASMCTYSIRNRVIYLIQLFAVYINISTNFSLRGDKYSYENIDIYL